ncbi:MAG TPA: MFS transporter [Solirubrobacteraceae bacterium]|nr:MFS transporter [Solirubrobacteraceae bacterium]
MTTLERGAAAPEPPPTAPAGPAAPVRSRKQAILLLCCVAQFMVILDLSIVNVALPSIQVGLHFSSAALQWVIDAYAIVFAGFLMLCGRAADVIGQRRTFLAALVVFSGASLAGGLAADSTMLIVARAVQGFGGALMAACSLAILTSTFAPGPERHRAIALWSSMNGAGGAIGVLLSGMITQWTSWRWILLINVPIGVLAAIAAIRVVTERRSGRRESFDIVGALVLTIGQVLIAYGCVNAGTDGWGTHAAWIPIIIGAALLALFPVIESRAKNPLVPAAALSRHLKLINLIVLLFSAALFPMWYMGSLYMQQVLSLQPITTGIAFLPMALVIMLCARRAGGLVGRFGVKPVLAGGLTFMTGGMALFAMLQPSGSAIQYIVLPGLLMTMGIGLSIVPSTIAATQSASPERAGFASGLVNTSRQVGGSLGLAVLISIATLHTSQLIGHNEAAQPALTDGFRLGYLVGAGCCAAALLLTLFALPAMPRVGAPLGTNPATPPRPLGKPRTVAFAVAAVVAVFAVLGLALPRSHGAPIGEFTTKGAYSFVSAPNLHPPKVTGGPTQVGEQLPGDIMVANFYDLTQQPMVGQSGPLILGGDLQPIWFQPVPTNVVASNLEAQTYAGKPVLSWWQGDVTATGQINSGEDVVVNQHYQRIATLKGVDGWIPTLHEFVIRGNYAWVTANKNVPAQLAKYGGVNGGAMIDSAVQEYNLRTGKLVYSWVASKHISPNDSEAVPPENGFPWDIYHVNSVDPLNNGTFLVSMRNTWAIYLVDEKTGKIEWTLGGKHSSFKVPKADEFEWQHDAQLLSPTKLSVFDDHCCDITGAGVYLNATGPSRGLVLSLDTANHTVKLDEQYSHGVTVESRYMGNVQTLPNGNAFVGWGDVPFMSEFSKSGQLIFDAVFPTPDITYRAYVQKWVGLPLYPPSGAVRTKNGATTIYASWNGATRLASWKVLALGGGTPQVIASKATTGFETAIPVNTKADTFEVQALDASGRVIGTSRSFSTR